MIEDDVLEQLARRYYYPNKIISNCLSILVLIIIILIFFIFGSNGLIYDELNKSLRSDWSNCNGNSWIWDDSIGYDDNYSLRSGPIECIGVSSICKEIKGRANICFWWKTDTSSRNGQFLLLIDNVKILECNSQNWSKVIFSLRENSTHKIEWRFSKAKSYPRWQGSGWIDSLTIDNELTMDPLKLSYTVLKTNIENPSFSTPGLDTVSVVSILPANNDIKSLNKSICFQFIPQHDDNLSNCMLYLDNNQISSLGGVYNNKTTSLNYTFNESEIGKHFWSIRCCDEESCNSSTNRSIFIYKENEITYAENGKFNKESYIYPSIQQAINNVSENGTVIVFDGYFEENILINKSLKLISNNNSTIKYKNKNMPTIQITSNYTSIIGFRIEGYHECINASISGTTNNLIKNVFIKDNIIINQLHSGITLLNCSSYFIINNIINKESKIRNQYCIYLSLIPEKFSEKYIDKNKLYNSDIGVRAPKSSRENSSSIYSDFTTMIKTQYKGDGEDVYFE